MHHASALLLLLCACGDPSPTLDGPVAEDASSIDALPVTVQFTITDPLLAPEHGLVVAYQDGDGPWTAAPPPTAGTYGLPITAARYGVVVGCIHPFVLVPRTEVYYFTRAEMPHFTTRHCGAAEIEPMLINGIHGRISGLTNGSFLDLGLLDRDRGLFADISMDGPYSIYTYPGLHDVIAQLKDLTNTTSKAMIARQLPVNGTLNIDVTTLPAVLARQIVGAPAGVNYTIAGGIALASGGTAILSIRNSPSVDYVALATEQRITGDLETLSVDASEGTTTLQTSRGVSRWGAPTSAPFVLSPVVGSMTVASAHSTITWTAAPTQLVKIDQTGTSASITAWLSKDYLDGASAWTVPDLSTLPTWNTMFDAGATGRITHTLSDSNGDLTQLIQRDSFDGLEVTYSSESYQL